MNKNDLCKKIGEIVKKYKNEILWTVPIGNVLREKKWLISFDRNLIYLEAIPREKGADIKKMIRYNLKTNSCSYENLSESDIIGDYANRAIDELKRELKEDPYKTKYDAKNENISIYFEKEKDPLPVEKKFISVDKLCSKIRELVNEYNNELEQMIKSPLFRLKENVYVWGIKESGGIISLELPSYKRNLKYYIRPISGCEYRDYVTGYGKKIKSIPDYNYNYAIKTLIATLKYIKDHGTEIKIPDLIDKEKIFIEEEKKPAKREEYEEEAPEEMHEEEAPEEVPHREAPEEKEEELPEEEMPKEEKKDYKELKDLIIKQYPIFNKNNETRRILNIVLNRIKIVEERGYFEDPYLKYQIILLEKKLTQPIYIDLIKSLKNIGFEIRTCRYSTRIGRYCIFSFKTPRYEYVFNKLKEIETISEGSIDDIDDYVIMV